jgi:hypothetical protein
MKGASGAILVLLLAGGVIGYLTMDKIGYAPPSSFSEVANPEDPSQVPSNEAAQPILEEDAAEVDEASGLTEQPASDAQQAPAEGQTQLYAARAAIDAERQTVEQERQRLASWEGELTQQSIWIQQAQQNLLDAQLELNDKHRELNESIVRLKSIQSLYKASWVVLEKEREQVRREKEQLYWLQVGTLVLMDLILIIEIARLRRPVLLWLRARKVRSAAPDAKSGTVARRDLGPT